MIELIPNINLESIFFFNNKSKKIQRIRKTPKEMDALKKSSGKRSIKKNEKRIDTTIDIFLSLKNDFFIT